MADSTRHMRNSAARLRESCCFNQRDLAQLRKRLFLLFEVFRKPHFRREALRSAKSRTTHKVYTDPPRSSTSESTNQTHEDIGRRCRNPLAPTANGRNGVMRSAPKRNSPGFRGPQPHENHAAPTERTAWYHKFTHTKLGDAVFLTFRNLG